jgi:uncharacterized protein YneF (UPF0154 family)
MQTLFEILFSLASFMVGFYLGRMIVEKFFRKHMR